MLHLSVLFGCVIAGVFAEIYEFNGDAMPDSLALSGYYMFHVYANASVTFKRFEVEWPSGHAISGADESLQASLMPWSKYQQLANKNFSCSATGHADFLPYPSIRAIGSGIFSVNVGAEAEASFTITQTDAYILSVANCGKQSGANMMAGQVIVKQEYGYLPGNKYFTLQWFGWFAIASAFLCGCFGTASVRHYKTLVYTQKVIAALALMAFFEAVSAYLQHKVWNNSGTRSNAMFGMTMLFYSVKYILALRMVSEAVTGAGLTLARLEQGDKLKLDVFCFVLLTTQWFWKGVISYKHAYMLKPTFLLEITIPSALLWLVLFLWVFRKFQAVEETARDQNLAAKVVAVFINMRSVLVLSVMLASALLLVQCAEIVESQTPWNLQWVPYDAGPHVVFTLFQLAMMILWWPRADDWKYSYDHAVSQDDCEGGSGAGQNNQVWPEKVGIGNNELFEI